MSDKVKMIGAGAVSVSIVGNAIQVSFVNRDWQDGEWRNCYPLLLPSEAIELSDALRELASRLQARGSLSVRNAQRRAAHAQRQAAQVAMEGKR